MKKHEKGECRKIKVRLNHKKRRKEEMQGLTNVANDAITVDLGI